MKESFTKRPIKRLTKFQSKNNTTFILCGCASEVLVIDYDDNDKIADFCIYANYGHSHHRVSIWQKIKYIWQIIIYGKPFSDQIILSKNQLKELYNFLSQI